MAGAIEAQWNSGNIGKIHLAHLCRQLQSTASPRDEMVSQFVFKLRYRSLSLTRRNVPPVSRAIVRRTSMNSLSLSFSPTKAMVSRLELAVRNDESSASLRIDTTFHITQHTL